MNRKHLENWSLSTYCEEVASGSNLSGYTMNNNANVYCWSFSSDPVHSITHGAAVGSHRFSGNEQLSIQFGPETQGSNYTLDVYAFAETILECSMTTIKIVSI